MGLLELTVLRINKDLAAKEEQHMQLELRAEADRIPDSIRLRRIHDGEPEAGQVGTQKRAHGEGYLACHCRAYNHRLVSGRIDIRIPLPAEIVFFFWIECDVENIPAVNMLATREMEQVVALAL